MVNFEETLKEFAESTIEDIRYNMSHYDMRDSNLSKSLEYTISGNNVKIYAAPYFKYAEVGRGPGGVPRNFTEILENWIVSHGIKPKTSLTEFANAIKWKTIKHGSSIYRGERPNRDFIGDAIKENIDILQDTCTHAVVKTIED